MISNQYVDVERSTALKVVTFPQILFGVVQANVGQKLLICENLRVLFGD